MSDKVSIKAHSGIYTLRTQQELPLSISQAWDFFSNPKNLEAITPDHMGFKITSEEPGRCYSGQIISYNIRPLPFFKSSWVTEITFINAPHSFIDEQRFGPYSMWHHEHMFEETANGVLITDKVSYKIPLGPLGKLANALFVRNQLIKIFEYRYKKLEMLFPMPSLTH